MPLQSGARLGSYEILALVSSGNGADIYKGTDTRANRAVTIKLLSPGAPVRPRNDAQTISSLIHPNICALYDVGEQDGAGYIVTEYIEGQTLAQRFSQGPMPLDEALKIAIAIADALDKAHRRGITHRGLTPTSIMLTASGAKLMDFGLASLEFNNDAAATLPPSRTAAASLAAVPAFAAPYLAPEQWEAKGADARTDIFALGAILYEMVAGKPAFEGKTPALLIAAIETIDPEPVSKAQPMAPAALDYIVKRCLAKDPKQRLQTALDLMSQLQWIAEGGSQIGVPAPVAARRVKTDRVVWAGLAVALLLIVAMSPAVYHYFKGAPEPEDIRFILPNMGSTGAGGPPASISPDGRWVVRSQGGANLGLDAVLLNSVTHQTLVRDNVVTQPFWSPDSRSIGFLEDGKLKVAEVAGGPARIVSDWPAPVGGGTWNSAGVILVASGGLIHRVMAAGGQLTPITVLDAARKETEHLAPFFLPDGRHYLYLSVSSQPGESAIYAAAIDSKERTRLFAADSKAVFAQPGYVFFNRDGTLFAQPFDAGKLALKGDAVRIADNLPFVNNRQEVSQSLSRSASFGVSDTGVLTYRIGTGPSTGQTAGNVADRTLLWIDRAGSRVGQVGGPAAYAGVDLSPDGKRVAVHVHDGGGGDDWFFDSAQGRMQRLTFDADQDNSSPLWSPDGSRIAFASRRNGKWGLYLKPVDGSASEELITESDTPKAPMSWSPDGKLLVYWALDSKTRDDVWAVPVTGDKKPIPILQSLNQELTPQLSPDGKWIAYSSNETSRPEIYIKPFPEGPGKWQVSTEGGIWPRWRHDGKELFFALSPNMMAADITVAGPSIQAGLPRVLFALASNPGPATTVAQVEYLRYAVSADGQRFLIPQQAAGGPAVTGSLADLLATAADQGGTSAGATSNSLMVILNWTHLLKRK